MKNKQNTSHILYFSDSSGLNNFNTESMATFKTKSRHLGSAMHHTVAASY